ncbi:VOC family protein [Nonomuraea spiralis]|uniref:VOC family protein n=1 Tax=Nonomuraea spiralis TaxID=46182 RepID=UPI0037BAC192
MPIHEQYEPGEPCWVDYGALDPAGARAFYGELFGWTFREEAGYSFVELGGQVVGGFGRVPAGLPASWNTYLAAQDVDAVAVRVKELGGSVVFGPMAAGADGRVLFAADSSGAAVGFWEGHRPAGIVLAGEPGTWCAHELWSAAATFYRDLFGDRFGEPPGGGLAVRDRTGARPQWVTFFAVADRAASAATAVRLGATIAPGYPRATIVRDPWGALFALA